MNQLTWRKFAAPLVFGASVLVGTLSMTAAAHAFCGFYVGKADASLFNDASQVIMARDGNRTVISMLNDYKGQLTEFALVVPVPSVLSREQINVGDRKIFDRIDGYSSPRLAEYHDSNPCDNGRRAEMMMGGAPPTAPVSAPKASADKALGVAVEASYTVSEYDIVILSANQSDGLETWLIQNGYRIPAGASKALGPYIKQQMKFFVAKVNIKEQKRSGNQTLRPIQFAFESEKFMLPLRLGMLNSNGPQDLIVYMLTRQGRVESTNYRTVKLPANMDLPVFIRGEFNDFYKAFFSQQAQRENLRAVFTEYFWDMAWCDPCAANPLSEDELKSAGVFWLGKEQSNDGQSQQNSQRRFVPQQGANPVMLTRLHVRYTRDSFPEDLMFQETQDRQNFQTRYVLRHPYKGPTDCEAARGYLEQVARRQDKEAQVLADLTGWQLSSIKQKMPAQFSAKPSNWWNAIWPR